MITKYIFYVPTDATLQFADVLSLPPLPSTTIERREYKPKETVTRVTPNDYIVLCIDMCQIFRIGDYDGQFNAFLAQCEKYGDKVSVLMKGAPKDMNFQRWNAQKGRLLSQLDDAGRLWAWESLAEEAKGTDRSNTLQRFMRAVRREDKNKQKTLSPTILVLVVIAIILLLFNIKMKGVKQEMGEKIEVLANERLLLSVGNCLDTTIEILIKEMEEWENKLQKHQKLLDDEDTRKNWSKDDVRAFFAQMTKFENEIENLEKKEEEVSPILKEIEEELAKGKSEQVLFVENNEEKLQNILNKYCNNLT